MGALCPGGLPRHILLRSGSGRSPPPSSKKKAYLRLSDNAVQVGDGCDTAVWLARGSGAKCVALSARKLSLPWDDSEFSSRWTPHPLSRCMIKYGIILFFYSPC
jgi:hypothetical protein